MDGGGTGQIRKMRRAGGQVTRKTRQTSDKDRRSGTEYWFVVSFVISAILSTMAAELPELEAPLCCARSKCLPDISTAISPRAYGLPSAEKPSSLTGSDQNPTKHEVEYRYD